MSQDVFYFELKIEIFAFHLYFLKRFFKTLLFFPVPTSLSRDVLSAFEAGLFNGKDGQDGLLQM